MGTDDEPRDDVRRVWFDFDGDGKPDVELSDPEVLARLFPPEVVELVLSFISKDKDT